MLPKSDSKATSSKQFPLPRDLNVSLLQRIAILSTIVALAMGAWQIAAGRPVTGLAIICMSIAMGVTFIRIHQTEFTESSLNWLLAIMGAFMLLIGLVSGREVPAITMLVPLLPFTAAAIGARRSAVAWLIISACLLLVLYLTGKWQLRPFAEVPDNFTPIYFVLTGILTVTITLVAYTLMGRRAEYLAAIGQSNSHLETALADASRANEAKGKFLGRMNHELRTPLNAIIGFADLLVRDTKNPLPDVQLERIHHVQRSGRHLLTLVDEVLEITRNSASYEPIALQPVLPLAVITEVVETARELADGKLITIEVDAAPHESTLVPAHRKYLVDVLGQLITNAVIYNRTGGRVNITVEVGDTHVRINVTDTGWGIKADDIPLLFEPFTHLSQPQRLNRGAGLGLTIAKSLMEQMGGKIQVASRIDEGSTFSLVLPRLQVGGKSAE